MYECGRLTRIGRHGSLCGMRSCRGRQKNAVRRQVLGAGPDREEVPDNPELGISESKCDREDIYRRAPNLHELYGALYYLLPLKFVRLSSETKRVSGLERKYFILSGFGASVLIGAIALLFYFCNHGFTNLVGISAKNLSALYTTGELKSLWWKEMSTLEEYSQHSGDFKTLEQVTQKVSTLTEKLVAGATDEQRVFIQEFSRIHAKVVDDLLDRVVEGHTRALYGEGADKLTEFGDAVLLGSQEEQGESIRRANFIMKIAFFSTVGFTVVILLFTFLYFKKRIIRPITVISAASLQAARGEFNPLTVGDSQDEISVLAFNFNHMMEEIRRTSESIRSERDNAERANHAKSAFLANMSHELRTPMHGILSFARFGQQKIDLVPKERLKSYFDEIYESGSRLMILLNDILDLSKLEAGKIVYAMKERDLLDVATAVTSEMRAFAEEKGLTLEYSGRVAEAIGTFDEDRVMQVVRNLASNAIKFSDPGTTVRIEVSCTPETLVCRVVNRGVGIPHEELETVFDKFVQSSKTKTGAGGTGLGLAICREIVGQHGGKIWAESMPNGETVFFLQLPITPAGAAQRAA